MTAVLRRFALFAFALLGLVSGAQADGGYQVKCVHYYQDSAVMINTSTAFVKEVGLLGGFVDGQKAVLTCDPTAISTLQDAAGYYVTGWDFDKDWGDNLPYPGIFSPTHCKQYGAVNPLTVVFDPTGVGEKSPVILELVPHISMMHYTLAYDKNASEATGIVPTSADHYWNESVTTSGAAFSRTGYTMSGWNTAANGSGVAIAMNHTISGATFPVTNHQQSVTLYAQWSANQYMVQLEATDAESTSHATSFTATYDQKPAKIASLPTRQYWKFDGYYTQPDGEGGTKVFNANGEASGVWNYTNINKLYAHWVRYKCTVTFKKEGPGSVNLGGSHEYDSGTVVSPKAIPDTYGMFLRWSDGETMESHSDITVISNATYTAYFSNITYTVTFNYMNSTYELKTVTHHYERDAKIYPPTDYMKIAGKKFVWDPAVDEFAKKDSAHNSSYVAETYQVFFVGNGADGGSMSPMPFEYESEKKLTKNTFTRTGYVFLGWNTDAKATTALYGDEASLPKALAESITLYAIWTPNHYSVKFSGGEGATGSMPDQDFTYDVAQALSANGFANQGQEFRYWHDALNDQNYTDGQIVSNLTAVADGEVALTAVWSNYHYVRFDRNGATNEHEMAVQKFTDAEATNLTANVYGRIGYTFAGWATNLSAAAELKVAYTNCQLAAFPDAKANETNVLYAVWSTNHYTIAFDPSWPSIDATAMNHYYFGEMEPLTNCAYDTAITIKCGYTNYCSKGLLGWSRTKGADTPDYAVTIPSPATQGSDAVVSNLVVAADETITLYAVWSGVGTLSGTVGLQNAALYSTPYIGDKARAQVDWKNVERRFDQPEWDRGHDQRVACTIVSGATEEAVPSGSICGLNMPVYGCGEITFKWCFRSEATTVPTLSIYDHGLLITNLVSKKQVVQWVTGTISLSASGPHLISWRFSGTVKSSTTKEDIIALDDITWTPGLEVKPGAELPTFASEAEAQSAAKVTRVARPNAAVESVVSAEDYNAMFQVKPVQTSVAPAEWTLVPELKPAVTNEVQGVLRAATVALCSAITNNPISVAFNMKPGLYYGLAATNELKWMSLAMPAEWVLGDGSEKSVSAPQPTGLGAFYELRMAVTPPAP